MTSCIQNRQNCIFNSHGRCEILTDTYFNRACPFFKQAPDEIIQDHYIKGKAGVYRDIRGFGGRYYIGEYGEVVSKFGNTMVITPNKSGKPTVQLQRPSGAWTTQTIAILVADAFIGGNGEVEHIDGDIRNCERWNLRRRG